MRANSSGVHLLSCPGVVETLVRRSGVGPGDLVIDFGAGPGTLTAPLAHTGSTVLAVERDDEFARALRRRFATRPSVRVVHDDLRRVRLPHRDFKVVSNIPFAVSTTLLRRLLSPVPARCALADLVVAHGLARRLTAPRPRDLESAWWAARFDLRLVRRIPARCFTPAPSVDAAHLSVRRRSDVDGRSSAVLFAVLRAVHRRPAAPARAVLGELAGHRLARRALVEAGADPSAAAASVRGGEWVRVARVLARERGIVVPRLPSWLRA
ncbi:MAG TPA: rRNA adenine N(6)-methyltransferase family protein [Actinophytocola sp.]|jgi:23S rRNA (adenine-N6)-dimethyltransferase|nr:rRNA adenine N(6)-methyltransferase family protein [Actinophytocola sp.]